MKSWSPSVLTFAVVLVSCASVLPARASVPLLSSYGGPHGYGTDCLYHNDDGSSHGISLDAAFPEGLRFFAETHHSVYVNTNGNITFSGPLATFTPQAFPVAHQPMIAPYWADVDIRFQDGQCRGPVGYSDVAGLSCQNPPENGVWWHMEPGLFVVTWDRVGYYNCKMDKRMSFQLILREPSTPAACGGHADFDVEFRFNQCEWNAGDASGGSGGLWAGGGGASAQAGFDAGDQQNYVEVPGSRTHDIHSIMCNQSNVGEPGVWRYEIRGGVIGGCPGAGEPCDTGLLGLCAHGVTQCAGASTTCQPLFEPSPEQCSGLDESCDGLVDNGDDLCGGIDVCHLGMCVPPCMEFGCVNEGQVCGPDDICVDAACAGVYCEEGLRCVEGQCVEPCHGVVCPHGQECRVGRCLDICDSIACDECTVCVDGACVTSCEWEDCPPGKSCMPDGRCVEDACATVTCNEGFYCEGGSCLDACIGTVCPPGEGCHRGECLPGYENYPGNGGGSDPGDGSGPGGGGRPGDPNSPDGENGYSVEGSGCHVDGAGSSGFLAIWLIVAAAFLRELRRRGRARA